MLLQANLQRKGLYLLDQSPQNCQVTPHPKSKEVAHDLKTLYLKERFLSQATITKQEDTPET